MRYTNPHTHSQKGKTNLDFTEARDSEWQWHQLGHMQVCTSLQRDNHASTSLLEKTGRMPSLPPNQERQSTEGKQSTDLVVQQKSPKTDLHLNIGKGKGKRSTAVSN